MERRLIQFNQQNSGSMALVKSIRHHLATHFKDQVFSLQTVEDWITTGKVYLGDKVCKNRDFPVKAKSSISLWVDSLTYKFNIKDRVVYEDDHLIAIDKPSGLPTQATLDPRREHLFNQTIALLTDRQPQKLAYVGLHHRLDQDTSGVVLMTKKRSANKGVGDLFKHRQINKLYLAVIEPALDEKQREKPSDLSTTWNVRNHLKKTPNNRHRFFFASANAGGQWAETRFEKIKTVKNKTLVKAWPQTGRTHQIRVHLSESGWPIVGDRVYGVLQKPATRLCLHCSQLEFSHPISGERVLISASMPKEFASLGF